MTRSDSTLRQCQARTVPRGIGRSISLALLGLVCATSCEAVMPAMRVIASAFSNYDPKIAHYTELYEDLVAALAGESSPARAEPSTAVPDLQLDVAILRQVDLDDGSVRAEAIDDGATLYDHGDLDASDRFKLFVRPDQRCHVYVVNVDATGWVTPLFPSVERFGEGVPAGTEVFLPEGDDLDLAYALDAARGVETFYIVASRQRRPDIEAVLARFASLERPHVDDPQTIDQLDASVIFTRGVLRTDVQHRATLSSAAGSLEFDTATFLQQANADLVITRWFHHR